MYALTGRVLVLLWVLAQLLPVQAHAQDTGTNDGGCSFSRYRDMFSAIYNGEDWQPCWVDDEEFYARNGDEQLAATAMSVFDPEQNQLLIRVSTHEREPVYLADLMLFVHNVSPEDGLEMVSCAEESQPLQPGDRCDGGLNVALKYFRLRYRHYSAACQYTIPPNLTFRVNYASEQFEEKLMNGEIPINVDYIACDRKHVPPYSDTIVLSVAGIIRPKNLARVFEIPALAPVGGLVLALLLALVAGLALRRGLFRAGPQAGGG